MDTNGKLVSRRRRSDVTTSPATTTTKLVRSHSSYNTTKDGYGRTTHKTSHMQMSGGYVNRSSGSRGNYKEEVYKSSFKQQAVSNGGGYYTKSYAVEVKVTEKLTYRNSYPKANAVRARW